MASLTIEEMSTFCKKKGFVYQNSEIYGSLAGFWDFGPLGAELKNNIKQHWWKTFVQSRDDVVGLDGSVITHAKVWEASGHVQCFQDVMLVCPKCKTRLKQEDGLVTCPNCDTALKKDTAFNLMFKTNVGPLETKESTAYLRPETAQLIFADFRLLAETSRLKLPFGVAQIGKAFRNEISPRDFLFRSREFEMMEIEYFVHPDKINDCPYFDEVKDIKVSALSAEAQEKKRKEKNKKKEEEGEEEMTFNDAAKRLTTKWHAYWLAINYKWFVDLGIRKENLRIRQHRKDELAHYAGACFDIEYRFPFGWKEIHGNADRTQFDLKQHLNVSQKDLAIFDEETKQKVIPYVASEPSQGVERAFLAFMFDAYDYDKERGNVVLRLHPALAPVKVGVFSLVNKLDDEARKAYNLLKKEFVCLFDRSGSIGRRYARADEIGIPYCVTVDFGSLKDKSVTIRNRDDTKQIRVGIKDLKGILSGLLNNEMEFEKAGKIIK